MKIITKKEEVLARLTAAGQNHAPLFCPNGETTDEIEGILSAAALHRQQRQWPTITVGLGITGTYPDHPQLKRLDLASDLASDGIHFAREADSIESRAFLWLDWLEVYTRQPDLFPGVEVIPFLDHGWVPSPADLALMHNERFQERMGIIMFDASLLPYNENMALTAEYVRHAGARVVVEACPDKILSARDLLEKKAPGNLLTDPDGAEKFVRNTGVDLIVPSLGTEHRGAPGESIYYRRELAQDLQQRLGPILALHGTSSLGKKITEVGSDGIVKVNYYTGMARSASEAVRANWATSNRDGLKIEMAAGSYLHNIRRQQVRDNCLQMLQLLSRTSPT